MSKSEDSAIRSSLLVHAMYTALRGLVDLEQRTDKGLTVSRPRAQAICHAGVVALRKFEDHFFCSGEKNTESTECEPCAPKVEEPPALHPKYAYLPHAILTRYDHEDVHPTSKAHVDVNDLIRRAADGSAGSQIALYALVDKVAYCTMLHPADPTQPIDGPDSCTRASNIACFVHNLPVAAATYFFDCCAHYAKEYMADKYFVDLSAALSKEPLYQQTLKKIHTDRDKKQGLEEDVVTTWTHPDGGEITITAKKEGSGGVFECGDAVTLICTGKPGVVVGMEHPRDGAPRDAGTIYHVNLGDGREPKRVYAHSLWKRTPENEAPAKKKPAKKKKETKETKETTKKLDKTILDRPLSYLGLPPPVNACLKRAGARLVGNLVRWTEEDVLLIKGIGSRRCNIIKSALKEHGLFLAETKYSLAT